MDFRAIGRSLYALLLPTTFCAFAQEPGTPARLIVGFPSGASSNHGTDELGDAIALAVK